MNAIKFLEDCDVKYISELMNMEFDKTVKSSYAPDRVETWFGYGSNLQSVKDGRSVVEWRRDLPEWLEELRIKYSPSSNSVLICKGVKPLSDTSIDWHRDHGNFENSVVMINFGEAVFYLQDYEEGTLVNVLKDCSVVDFNSKLLHKSTQISDSRFIITFRRVKTQFSIHKLF